jgi:hypothetical protein
VKWDKKVNELREAAFAGANHGFPHECKGNDHIPEPGTPDDEEFTLRAQCMMNDWFPSRQVRETLAKLDAARELAQRLEHHYDLLAEAVGQNSGDCDKE